MAGFLDEKRSTGELHPSEALEFVIISPIGASRSNFAGSNPRYSTNTITQVETRVNDYVSNDEFNRRLSFNNANFSSLAHDTKAATEAEHKMTFLEGVRLYPKAMAWSILLSLIIVMEGSDITPTISFYAFPEFRKAYGQPTANAACMRSRLHGNQL